MKKKEKIVLVGLILLLVVTIVGVSYAAFSYSKRGEKVNTITTGQIVMTYTETDNIIQIDGALPTTDKTGTVQLKAGEYFDFNISSTIVGNVNINYEISAKEVGESTIAGSNIKLYLTKLNGSEEESLMTPETYHEESEENTYTGRPAGEMSLYKGSMNSSENNNYRLRMYVDENYNPQGDGGGLTFSVKINVYGLAGEKYVPETTKTLLAANPVQEEKTDMFNYASNGSYIDMNAGGQQTNPEYITNGLYSAEDEDGVSYYFRGNVENNNVQFGEYLEDYYVYVIRGVGDGAILAAFHDLASCEEYKKSDSLANECLQEKLASKGDKMYWKIVRVNGDGSLRLIYNGTSSSPSNSELASSFSVGYVPYNLKDNEPKYTGYTYDNGTDSFIKREVDTWYQNTLGKSNYDRMVTSGRFCSDSSGYQEGSFYNFSTDVFPDGSYLYASMGERLANFARGASAVANSPTLKCPSTNESYGGSYRLKAGLITADELALAGELYGVVGNSYLNPGDNGDRYWSMTPSNFFNGYAYVWGEFDGFFDNSVSAQRAVRPVINVTTNNGFASGDGTAQNPYILNAE